MLKIHNNNFKKYRIPLISAFVVVGGMFLFSSLTYIPTQTFAADGSEEQRTLMNIKYMQQMSEQICTNTKENKTKQLIDVRDGKKYWVAKLKDGNCWMTQNLDYDITTSDIPNIMIITDIKEWIARGDNPSVSNTTPAYFDPGDWIYDKNYYNQEVSGCDYLAESCKEWSLANTTSDWHYSVGNYYSWAAATKNSGNVLQPSPIANADGSICSSGWRLPSNRYENGATGLFKDLLDQYGISTGTNVHNVEEAPLYFVYGGFPDNNGSEYASLMRAGNLGWYWSSGTMSMNNTSALSFTFTDSSITPNNNMTRNFGASVRCYSPGGWLTSYPDIDDESVWPDPDFPEPLDSNQANVAITVSPVISIDATSGMSESIDFTQVAEGDITAKVSSNQAYQVLLSTEQSNLEQNPVLANFNIPMVTNDTEITAGVNSWGVKKTLSVTTGGTAGDDTTLTNTLYSPIGIGDDKALFYKSSGAESKTLVFPVAISVDATLPSGIYSTQVTITAVAN